MGMLHGRRGERGGSTAAIMRLATAGNAAAQAAMGAVFIDDSPSSSTWRMFPGVGLRMWTQAAAGGSAMAQNSLGMRYLSGKGAPRDIVEGARLLRLAVAQDEPNAMCTLASSILCRGVPPQGDETVFALYHRAAQLGSAGGMYWAGLYSILGTQGAVKDARAGLAWLEKAEARGDEGARSAIANFRERGTLALSVAGGDARVCLVPPSMRRTVTGTEGRLSERP